MSFTLTSLKMLNAEGVWPTLLVSGAVSPLLTLFGQHRCRRGNELDDAVRLDVGLDEAIPHDRMETFWRSRLMSNMRDLPL